jgi:hypothetical protein
LAEFDAARQMRLRQEHRVKAGSVERPLKGLKGRWGRARPLTSVAAKKVLSEGGLREPQLLRALRADIQRQRRIFKRWVRTGGARPQTVGDPTTFFCGLTATSVSETSSTLAMGNAAAVLTRPVIRQMTTGRNRTRFVASAFAAVEQDSLTMLDLDQHFRFSFTISVGGAVSPTVFLTPVGTYSLFAPHDEYVFPFWRAVPGVSLWVSANVSIVGSFPVGGGQNIVLLPAGASSTPIFRTLSGWGGPFSDVGLLQNVASSSSLVAPMFAAPTGTTVTMDVQLYTRLMCYEGGTVTLDTLSQADSGLNVPSCMLRVDY